MTDETSTSPIRADIQDLTPATPTSPAEPLEQPETKLPPKPDGQAPTQQDQAERHPEQQFGTGPLHNLPGNADYGDQDPTTLLGESFEQLEAPRSHRQAPLLTQSQFSRERQAEQDAAYASLDETVLRPAIDPIDLQGASQEPSRPPQPSYATPHQGEPAARARRSPWAFVGIVATVLVVAGAVAYRAQSLSRSSNVGFAGVASQVPVESLEPAEPEVEASVEPSKEAQPQEDEFVSAAPEETEATPEQEASPTTEETGETSTSHPWYPYRSPFGSGETGYEEDVETTTGEPTQDESSSPLRYDDEALTYTFDGGSLSYRYEDGTVTLEVDDYQKLLDGLGESWGSGSQDGAGADTTYDYWYDDGSSRERDRGYGSRREPGYNDWSEWSIVW